MSYEGAPENWIAFLGLTNYIFTTIFLIECILKLIAFDWSYFETGWNRFDFFVVVASLLDIGLELLDTDTLTFLSVGPQLARVMRVLRVSRVLRLAGKSEGLQALLQTITMSISSLMNVFLLLMLIFFMLSILGVFFFREITEGDIIDDYKNFTNFS